MFEFFEICRELELVGCFDFANKKIKVTQGIVVVYEFDFDYVSRRDLDTYLYRVTRLLKKRYGIEEDD